MAQNFWENDEVIAPAQTRAQPVPRRGAPQPIIAFEKPAVDPLDRRKDEIAIAKGERDLATGPMAERKAAADAAKAEAEAARIAANQDTTEGEKTAAFLGTRVASSLQNLARIGKANPDAREPSLLVEGVRGLPFFGETAANFLTDSDRQIVEAAELDLLDAALTLGTGAAYTAEQLAGYRKSYFPRLGDSPETRKAKEQSLKVLLEAARVKAGRASGEIDKALQAAGMAEAPAGLPQGTQIEFGMDGSGAPTGFRFNPQQLAQLQSFMAQNPNASAAELNAFSSGAFGQTLGTPEQVDQAMAYFRQTGQMPGIDYSTTDAMRQSELDAQLKARGQEGGTSTAGLIAQGITANLGDEAAGVAGGVMNALQGRSFVDGYTQERDLARRADEIGREREGMLPELFGSVVSPVGAFRAPAATVRGAAAQGAAGGAAFGFGAGEGAVDTVVDTAAGAALGAGLGAGAQRLLGGRGGGGGGPPRPAAQAYQDQLDAGVPNPTLGSTMGGAAAIAENALALSPGGGRVAAGIRENVEGAGQGAQALADRFGPGGSFASRGEALIEGANKWRDKAQAVVGKAYDAIPISPKAPASTPNTRAFLDGQADRFDSPVLQDAFANGKMARFSEAVDAGLTWRDIKGWRTEIGDLIGEAMIVGDGIGKKQLRNLYASLSDDMKATASSLGPDALRKFERANTLNRQKEERVEKALVSILGKDGTNPAERAAKLIDTISQNNSGSADIKKLAEIRKSIPGDEWDSVSSSMIRLLGQPLNKESRDFSPQSFVTAFKNMDPAAKNIIFGKNELRKELDGFANAMEGLATVQGSGNPSGTAKIVNVLFGLTNLSSLGTQALTANAASRLWTNPRFVQWATGYTKMAKGAAKAGKMPTAANLEKQLNLGGKAAAAAGASANDVLNMQAALRSAFEQSPGRLAAEPTDEQGQM